MRRTIYLDTTFWNRLFEQDVDPASLEWLTTRPIE
jgi:hypothetical protein